ncbi:MAG: glycosyltransferase family 4 protein, partial [Candidatus Omnitrophica bacterium]|nr:glycosyltransferase family 4 protein [Candidatus Omnitrophota bacterium]
RLIENSRPQIAHLHNIYHQISPSILHTLKQYGIPVVMSLHDFKLVCPAYTRVYRGAECSACGGGRFYHCLFKKCVKGSRIKSALSTVEMYLHHSLLHLYDLVDLFISPSVFLKDTIERMGVKGKIEVLPNFFEVNGIEPLYEGLDNTIVCFGRLVPGKGLMTLLDAMKDLAHLKLKIIGEGPERQRIEERIERERIGNVTCLGYLAREELYRHIRTACLAVFASELPENNPLSVIEAYALGKPVIGAGMGGTSELIVSGENGILVPPGDAAQLRSVLDELMNDKARISRMGRQARAYAEMHFQAERYYERLMGLYHLTIETRK